MEVYIKKYNNITPDLEAECHYNMNFIEYQNNSKLNAF